MSDFKWFNKNLKKSQDVRLITVENIGQYLHDAHLAARSAHTTTLHLAAFTSRSLSDYTRQALSATDAQCSHILDIMRKIDLGDIVVTDKNLDGIVASAGLAILDGYASLSKYIAIVDRTHR